MNFILLNHSIPKEAHRIWSVLQAAYKIEADLIEVADFVPLMRSSENIRSAKAIFYGCIRDRELIGVCEVEGVADGSAHIASLGVHPSHFRRGVGAGLVNYVLNMMSCEQITVNTAAKNAPAISLYEKLGFSICNRFETYDEVNMVTLKKNLQ